MFDSPRWNRTQIEAIDRIAGVYRGELNQLPPDDVDGPRLVDLLWRTGFAAAYHEADVNRPAMVIACPTVSHVAPNADCWFTGSGKTLPDAVLNLYAAIAEASNLA